MESKELLSTPEALGSYCQICEDACDRAEQILQEQEAPSEITSLARQVLFYATYLAQFDHLLNAAYLATKRMADCLFDHPRLLLEIKELELDILYDVEAQSPYSMCITTDLQAEVDRLRANIQAADEGRFDDIVTDSHLRHDPVEWTKAFEDVIDEAEHRAYAALTDVPRGMGFCFAYWQARRQALSELGIEWRSPGAMNPHVLFD